MQLSSNEDTILKLNLKNLKCKALFNAEFVFFIVKRRIDVEVNEEKKNVLFEKKKLFTGKSVASRFSLFLSRLGQPSVKWLAHLLLFGFLSKDFEYGMAHNTHI